MTEAALADRPRATAINGRRAGLDLWRGDPTLAAALHEVELTIFADVISESTGGPSTANDPLAIRCASRIAHLGVFSDERLDTASITAGEHLRDIEQMNRLAQILADRPRGTWQVWRGPEGGYSAWCSDGFGGVRCWGGETFGARTERAPLHDPVAAHAMLLQTIVYELRGKGRDDLVAHSIAAAVPAGVKLRDVEANGRTWTNATYLGPVDGTHQFAVSRRGQKGTLKAPPATALRILGAPIVAPAHMLPDDGGDRLSSPRERRSALAQAEFDRIADKHGLHGRWGSKAPFLRITEERLERTVYDDDHNALGRVEIVFDGVTPAASAYRPGAGAPSIF